MLVELREDYSIMIQCNGDLGSCVRIFILVGRSIIALREEVFSTL